MSKIKFISEYEWLLKILDNDDSDVIEIYLESGRGGGKNAQVIISFFAWMANNNRTFNAAVFRKQAKAIKELWNDFCEYAIYKYTITHKFQEMNINGNKLTFNSLFTSSGQPVGNLGKSMGLGKDYMIIWEDESTDITNEDRNKIEQAYGRFGKKLIIIRSWNPWSPINEIVEYMAKYMPYPGVDYMQKHHRQLVHKDVNGISSYFFRTSAYINPFASKPHILALEKQAALDPDEGNTILWAKPGIVEGAVYEKVDKCAVDDTYDYKLSRIIAGIDIGISDATTVQVLGIGSDNGQRDHMVHVLDEYFHQNEKGKVKKDYDDYVFEVIDYLINIHNKYLSHTNMAIHCYVDYARQTSKVSPFVAMLHQYVEENDLEDIIVIHKAKKEPVRDRITLTKYLIASGRFTIDKNKAPNLLREMIDAHYDTKRKTADGFHPRKDGNDHAINAFEYALTEAKHTIHTADYSKIHKNYE